MKQLKTFLYFLGLFALVLISKKLMKDDYKEGIQIYLNESENAKAIYTGRTRNAYNPIDQAYIVTDKLKEFIKMDIELPKISIPVLSVWVDPNDLYSEERGIVKNSFKRGRLWERASYIKLYHKGKLEFESFAGIRQHGNGSRKEKVKKKSYRFWFKKEYGEASFLKKFDITRKQGVDIERLVLRREGHFQFYNQFISYLYSKLGTKTAKFETVLFYLNGKKQGLYTITEHLTRKQFAKSVGHNNFMFLKLRGTQPIKDRVSYERMRGNIVNNEDLTYQDVVDLLDIETIISTLVVVMFTGNGDWHQGVFYKNMKKDQKWEYIPWDFDGAFRKSYYNRYESTTNDFNIAVTEMVVDHKKNKGEIFKEIFIRLSKNDDDFKDHFRKKIKELIHTIKSKETDVLLNHFESIAKENNDRASLRSINHIKNFLRKRIPIFCREIEKYISHSCIN